MPKLRSGQTNFTSGELSPLMAARSDVKLYANGAEKLKPERRRFTARHTASMTARYGVFGARVNAHDRRIGRGL